MGTQQQVEGMTSIARFAGSSQCMVDQQVFVQKALLSKSLYRTPFSASLFSKIRGPQECSDGLMGRGMQHLICSKRRAARACSLALPVCLRAFKEGCETK